MGDIADEPISYPDESMRMVVQRVSNIGGGICLKLSLDQSVEFCSLLKGKRELLPIMFLEA